MAYVRKNNICVIISLLLAGFFIILPAAAADVWNGDTDTGWYTSGTSPYTIRTSAELAGLAVLVNSGTDNFAGKKIQLASDLDLNGKPWTPIGTDVNSNRFQGSFDGSGYSISGLYISNSSATRQGLFGHVWGATITNVALKDVNVTARSYVGSLAGTLSASTVIENCYATGNVSGTRQYGWTGGLIGSMAASTVKNSYFAGTVNAWSYVGGLIGSSSQYNTIQDSFAAGTIIGNNEVGGLIGAASVASTVDNCYTVGTVTGNDKVGGLIGKAGSTGTAIRNSLALNQYINGSSNVGRVIGLNEGVTTVNLSGWKDSTNNGIVFLDDTINNGISVYPEDVWNLVSFAYEPWTVWNPSVWEITQNNPDYLLPTISGSTNYESLPNASYLSYARYFPGGNGLIESPFEIASEQDLLNLSYVVNQDLPYKDMQYNKLNYLVISDLNLSVLGLDSWTPIGSSYPNFAGTFDGGHHTIDGLNASGMDRVGLFGQISGSYDPDDGIITISNVSLINVNLSGSYFVGGLVGYNDGGKIANSSVTGTIHGDLWGVAVGGIAGYNTNMGNSISDCYTVVNITSEGSDAGGITGYMILGELSNCYAAGSVSAYDKAGGIAGTIFSGTVTNSVALNRKVNATTTDDAGYAGSIAGMADEDSIFRDNFAWDGMYIGYTEMHSRVNSQEFYEYSSSSSKTSLGIKTVLMENGVNVTSSEIWNTFQNSGGNFQPWTTFSTNLWELKDNASNIYQLPTLIGQTNPGNPDASYLYPPVIGEPLIFNVTTMTADIVVDYLAIEPATAYVSYNMSGVATRQAVTAVSNGTHFTAHLSGLLSDTEYTYHFHLIAGNYVSIDSAAGNFTTEKNPEPPKFTVENPAVLERYARSVMLTAGFTNASMPVTGFVYYNETGNSTVLTQPVALTNNNVIALLADLIPEKNYTYWFSLTDAHDRVANSSLEMFRTAAAPSYPEPEPLENLTVETPSVSEWYATCAIVTAGFANAYMPVTGTVYYHKTGNSTILTQPLALTNNNVTVILTNLEPETEYTYWFSIIDLSESSAAFSRMAVMSDITSVHGRVVNSSEETFKTAVEPDYPKPIPIPKPVIGEPYILERYYNSVVATVNATVFSEASGIAYYIPEGDSTVNIAPARQTGGNFTVVFTDLVSETDYRFWFTITDISGIPVNSSVGTFRTPGQPEPPLPPPALPVIFSPYLVSVYDDSAVVTAEFMANTPDAWVMYRKANDSTLFALPASITGDNLTVIFTELTPGTKYQYWFMLTDAFNETAKSEISEFTTLGGVPPRPPIIGGSNDDGPWVTRTPTRTVTPLPPTPLPTEITLIPTFSPTENVTVTEIPTGTKPAGVSSFKWVLIPVFLVAFAILLLVLFRRREEEN